MYKGAFWALFFITLVSMVIQLGGYGMIETVMFLIVIDFIALWLYLEKRKSVSGIGEVFVKRIENLETTCSNISESIGAVSSVMSLEETFNKHKEDVSMTLERINEKNMVLEEKLNTFRDSLVNHMIKNKDPEVKGSLETY